MVYTECTKMGAVSHGTSHVTVKQHLSTPLRWIFKNRLWKALQSSESAQERRKALYKSDLQYSAILRSWALTAFAFLPHILDLFITSLMLTAEHRMAAFTVLVLWKNAVCFFAPFLLMGPVMCLGSVPLHAEAAHLCRRETGRGVWGHEWRTALAVAPGLQLFPKHLPHRSHKVCGHTHNTTTEFFPNTCLTTRTKSVDTHITSWSSSPKRLPHCSRSLWTHT